MTEKLKAIFFRSELVTDRVVTWLSNRNLILLILLDLIINIFAGLFAGLIFSTIDDKIMANDSLSKQLLLGGVIFPLIETLVFHYYLIRFVNRRLSGYAIPAILISAILFGFSHTYSNAYILASFLIGLFLASLYYAYQKNGKNIILHIWIIHMANNTIAFMIPVLEKYLETQS